MSIHMYVHAWGYALCVSCLATMLWDCSSASPFEVSGRMDACVHWTMPLIPAAVLSMPVAVLLMPTTMLLMIMVLRSIQAQVGLMPAAMPWDCPLLPTTFAVFRNGGGPTVTSLPVWWWIVNPCSFSIVSTPETSPHVQTGLWRNTYHKL